MPRRRALTGAQLEDLLALPTSEPDLIRHWTLGRDDLAAIERRRGAHNQLGYTLQLCAFRYPGRLLRPGDVIPETALRFVSEQIRVGASALGAYASRRQTRREQLDALGCVNSPAKAGATPPSTWARSRHSAGRDPGRHGLGYGDAPDG